MIKFLGARRSLAILAIKDTEAVHKCYPSPSYSHRRRIIQGTVSTMGCSPNCSVMHYEHSFDLLRNYGNLTTVQGSQNRVESAKVEIFPQTTSTAKQAETTPSTRKLCTKVQNRPNCPTNKTEGHNVFYYSIDTVYWRLWKVVVGTSYIKRLHWEILKGKERKK